MVDKRVYRSPCPLKKKKKGIVTVEPKSLVRWQASCRSVSLCVALCRSVWVSGRVSVCACVWLRKRQSKGAREQKTNTKLGLLLHYDW